MSNDTKGKALKMACKAFDASLLHCATWKAQMEDKTANGVPLVGYAVARENLRKFAAQREAWKYIITLILEDETS